MKTARRPNRRGCRLAFAPRPAARTVPPTGLPPVSFTVPNFSRGRSITYTLTDGVYVYQVAGERAVRTEAATYPQAAAIARRAYHLPAIGTASYGGIAA